MALFGVNGFTAEIEESIKGLKELDEIILFFDGDKAGKEGVNKTGQQLQALRPDIKVSFVETPAGEDINSLSIGHEPEIFTHLVNERKPFSFLTEGENPETIGTSSNHQINTSSNHLNTSNPSKLIYETSDLRFTIWGGIEKDNLHRLKVNLLVSIEQIPACMLSLSAGRVLNTTRTMLIYTAMPNYNALSKG